MLLYWNMTLVGPGVVATSQFLGEPGSSNVQRHHMKGGFPQLHYQLQERSYAHDR